MKNSVLNLLSGGVFLMAIVAAFAFTQPVDQNELWGQEADGTWRNVTGLVPGPETYECDEQEIQCLYDAENGDPVENSEGQFIFHGDD